MTWYGDADPASPLGQFIRQQREIRNCRCGSSRTWLGLKPYLSQIVRGLREPSERVIDAIARNLEVSAERCTSTAAPTCRRGRRRSRPGRVDPRGVGLRRDNARRSSRSRRVHWASRPRPRAAERIRAATPKRRGPGLPLGDQVACRGGVRLRDLAGESACAVATWRANRRSWPRRPARRNRRPTAQPLVRPRYAAPAFDRSRRLLVELGETLGGLLDGLGDRSVAV